MDLDFALRDLVSSENLNWAWEKVRRYFRSEAAWRDELEIADFEANLGRELHEIAMQFAQGTYNPGLLRPFGQPKKKRGSEINNREIELRQMFWVPVRDQVAWVAVTNIIGPAIDVQMPAWSFGNRLHRSVWIDPLSDNRHRLRLGPYRRSSPLLYKTFAQSWPRYRRYVYLTLRKMISAEKARYFELEDVERNLLETESNSPEDLKFPYLKSTYWRAKKRRVFWAGVDFEKFYPRLNVAIIQNSFRAFSPHSSDPRMCGIVEALLRFGIDSTRCTANELTLIGMKGDIENFTGLPTGLVTAGFLANLAMLTVDKHVEEEIQEKQIAHFRYVDDHIFLGDELESILAWIKRYKELLAIEGGIATINADKVDPPELAPLIVSEASRTDVSKEVWREAALQTEG